MCKIKPVIRVSKPEYRTIIRRRMGLTQSDLAAILGFSHRYVTYLERGTRNSKNYDRKLEKLYEQYRKQSAQRRAA